MLSFWPSFALLLLTLVVFLECRGLAGRVTIPLSGFAVFFAYGAIGATLISLLFQAVPLFQFEPIENSHFDLVQPAAWLTAPLIEELAKALPLLILCAALRDWRRLSIADLTLIGFATGAGFGFIERNLAALVNGTSPNFEHLLLFGFETPVTGTAYEIHFAGHAVHTALLGLAAGVGLRLLRRAAFVPAALVFLLVWFDHTMYNWKNLHPGLAIGGNYVDAPYVVEFLYGLTAHGLIETWLLIGGLIVAQGVEAFLCARAVGKRSDLLLPREFGPWVLNEWFVIMLRLPLGRAALAHTLAYFRTRRAFALASLEAQCNLSDLTLNQYARSLEQRLLRQRTNLIDPPRGSWILPWPVAARAVLGWAWRVRAGLVFAVFFVLMFTLGRRGLPPFARDVLFGQDFTKAFVAVVLGFVAWRIIRFLFFLKPPDGTASDGAVYANYHTRLLLLGAALVCGVMPMLSLTLGWKLFVPESAYLGGYFGAWIAQGGNLQTLLALGAFGGAAEADPRPPGSALRNEIAAADERIRRLNSELHERTQSLFSLAAVAGAATKLRGFLPRGASGSSGRDEDLDLDEFFRAMSKIDAERDAQERRKLVLDECIRQASETHAGEFRSDVDALKVEFEQLAADLNSEAAKEFGRMAALELAYGRAWALLMRDLDEYDALRRSLGRAEAAETELARAVEYVVPEGVGSEAFEPADEPTDEAAQSLEAPAPAEEQSASAEPASVHEGTTVEAALEAAAAAETEPEEQDELKTLLESIKRDSGYLGTSRPRPPRVGPKAKGRAVSESTEQPPAAELPPGAAESKPAEIDQPPLEQSPHFALLEEPLIGSGAAKPVEEPLSIVALEEQIASAPASTVGGSAQPPSDDVVETVQKILATIPQATLPPAVAEPDHGFRPDPENFDAHEYIDSGVDHRRRALALDESESLEEEAWRAEAAIKPPASYFMADEVNGQGAFFSPPGKAPASDTVSSSHEPGKNEQSAAVSDAQMGIDFDAPPIEIIEIHDEPLAQRTQQQQQELDRLLQIIRQDSSFLDTMQRQSSALAAATDAFSAQLHALSANEAAKHAAAAELAKRQAEAAEAAAKAKREAEAAEAAARAKREAEAAEAAARAKREAEAAEAAKAKREAEAAAAAAKAKREAEAAEAAAKAKREAEAAAAAKAKREAEEAEAAAKAKREAEAAAAAKAKREAEEAEAAAKAKREAEEAAAAAKAKREAEAAEAAAKAKREADAAEAAAKAKREAEAAEAAAKAKREAEAAEAAAKAKREAEAAEQAAKAKREADAAEAAAKAKREAEAAEAAAKAKREAEAAEAAAKVRREAEAAEQAAKAKREAEAAEAAAKAKREAEEAEAAAKAKAEAAKAKREAEAAEAAAKAKREAEQAEAAARAKREAEAAAKVKREAEEAEAAAARAKREAETAEAAAKAKREADEAEATAKAKREAEASEAAAKLGSTEAAAGQPALRDALPQSPEKRAGQKKRGVLGKLTGLVRSQERDAEPKHDLRRAPPVDMRAVTGTAIESKDAMPVPAAPQEPAKDSTVTSAPEVSKQTDSKAELAPKPEAIAFAESWRESLAREREIGMDTLPLPSRKDMAAKPAEPAPHVEQTPAEIRNASAPEKAADTESKPDPAKLPETPRAQENASPAIAPAPEQKSAKPGDLGEKAAATPPAAAPKRSTEETRTPPKPATPELKIPRLEEFLEAQLREPAKPAAAKPAQPAPNGTSKPAAKTPPLPNLEEFLRSQLRKPSDAAAPPPNAAARTLVAPKPAARPQNPQPIVLAPKPGATKARPSAKPAAANGANAHHAGDKTLSEQGATPLNPNGSLRKSYKRKVLPDDGMGFDTPPMPGMEEATPLTPSSQLAAALAGYYSRRREPPPPMHTTDTASLRKIIETGRLETPRRGATWSFSGILRKGDVVIRLKPGAEKYVELVTCQEAFGQVPRFYARGVGVGAYKTHIPVEHLEFFDASGSDWVPLNR